MREVNIMVGGILELVPLDQLRTRANQIWIGIDYGATFLLDHGITPQVALGDFDSTPAPLLQRLEEREISLTTFPPEKDYTDTQLGVKRAFLDYQPDRVNIYGATGGRLDQLLSNLYFPLLEEFQSYLDRLRLIDRQNEVTYYWPGEYTIEKLPEMKYLAFVNLTPVKGLTLPDEKYRLTNFDAEVPISWSSNEFVGEVNHFSFQDGVVAVIQSRDWGAR